MPSLPCLSYLDGVEGVAREDGADAAEPAAQEVLHLAHALLLRHGEIHGPSIEPDGTVASCPPFDDDHSTGNSSSRRSITLEDLIHFIKSAVCIQHWRRGRSAAAAAGVRARFYTMTTVAGAGGGAAPPFCNDHLLPSFRVTDRVDWRRRAGVDGRCPLSLLRAELLG